VKIYISDEKTSENFSQNKEKKFIHQKNKTIQFNNFENNLFKKNIILFSIYLISRKITFRK